MKTFPYVEDYLEVINGDRDPSTGKPYGLFNNTPPIVSLARYDVQILSSMSAATMDGKSLTDKQADLAIKIVLKYRKQLEKLEIDVTSVESPKFRLGIRHIDRRRLLYVEDNKLILKFAYDTKLINDIRDLAKISQGRWGFDSESRHWQLAITETNVVAAHGFASNNGFEISEDFKKYLDLVLECEKNPYVIELVDIDTNANLQITNAPASLTQAINNYCGFHRSNIDLLVDNAPVYGYTVNKTLQDYVIKKYSPRIFNLMTSLEQKYNPSVPYDVAIDIVEYAKVSGRFPIYVYEPNMSDNLLKNFVLQCFDDSEVYKVKDLKKEISTVHKKVIYFNKYMAQWDQPIPLLVSGQGMMHGGDKSVLLQRAEKIVYFATEVYNNINMKR